MGRTVQLRDDFSAGQLRALARQSRDADQTRRLLALASVCEGGSRSAATALGGVGLQTMRDWVLAFNAFGLDGLLNGKAPGRTAILTSDQRCALVQVVQSGPIPAIHGVAERVNDFDTAGFGI